jgi:hypothetical protein
VARTSPSLKGHALALMAPKRRVRGGEDAAQGGGARKTPQKKARTVHFAAPILGEQAGATGPGPSSAPRHSTQSAMLQQQARELEELRCARDADTESDESETVAPAASSGGVEHAGGMKVFRAEHRKKVTTEMMRLDKEAEEEAAELGLLMPRTLQALKTLRATAQQEGSVVVPPLSAGMVLRCKAFIRNRDGARQCGSLLPPRPMAKFEDIKTAANLLETPAIIDEGCPRAGATVNSLSGADQYTTNIHGDGGAFMQDVVCECSELSAREYGLPCAHCVGHAEYLGMVPEDIVHCKDNTIGWQRQYEGLDYPHLSLTAIQNSMLHDPTLQYPPVDAPKCGRPKKARRMKSSLETQRYRAKVRCSRCKVVGHNSRSVKCPQFARK